MLTVHRLLGTWAKQVDLFLVCTDFARRKFVSAGFDERRIKVKPNFIAADPGIRAGGGSTALFVGRLSPEKGPELLPPAWSKLSASIPLEIVGDGPSRAALEGDCARLGLQSIHMAGWVDRSAVAELLRSARFLIVPSTCYEGFPLAIAEAYGCGVPVIASGHGGLAEIVRDGFTGIHFRPGDAADLAAKVDWAWSHPQEMETMGRASRAEFEMKYTAAAALDHLETAYEFVSQKSAGKVSSAASAPGPTKLPLRANTEMEAD
jgi:glycosyltransferase involved in cell wall biosynthesis